MTSLLRLGSLLLLVALGQTPAVEPGYTSLWNGKDWSDWKVANPDAFSIQDGAIVANGTPGHAFYDGPFMNHSFRNFELKVDVMTRPNSNGGIFVLTRFQDKGFPSQGFEIQVNNTYAKDPVKTGSLYHVSDVTEALPKDGEWFTETIRVQGDTITVWVNDKQVVDWTEPAEWKTDPKQDRRNLNATGGTIALQAHDPNSTVYYRNIRIKPL
jgi:3-keto-disaccharide hydrolase